MNKLTKNTLPCNHTFSDFECFGPGATKDGEFENTKIADFGCFTQDGKDSNKYYHACVCKSKVNDTWFCFYQWGRVGKEKYDYQIIECSSEEEAQKVYEKQCHSKNDKRGEWYTHPALGKILRAKKNKDCYLVRNMATRLSALPDASKITTKKKVAKKQKSSNLDPQTEKLLQDLNTGTIDYSKSKFSSGHIPDLSAIEDARKILGEAAKAKAKDLEELTKILYSKIPKYTSLGEKVELSKNNIRAWYDDLDAFEAAYKGVEGYECDFSTKYILKYIDKTDSVFYNIQRLVESSTRNRHSYISNPIKILGLWEITNIPKEFTEKQIEVSKEFNGNGFPLIFQPQRTQLEQASNTQLLFHGSRTVNIGPIVSTGFRLPKELSGVAINGANLGGGAYHACDYKKSVGYCSTNNSYWARGSGRIANRQAFMFINDVILGNPHIVSRPKGFTQPPKGCHSVIADTRGSFQNEEFVVYETTMFYPRYLIEFDI